MEILTAADQQYLRERFAADLGGPVRVVVFSEPAAGLYVPGRRECETCADTERLMQEVAALDERIELEIVNVNEDRARAEEWDVRGTPTIVVTADGEPRVRFLGLPAGLEFTSFLETLVSASAGGDFGLQPATLERLAGLGADAEIKTFVTPT